MDLFSVFRLLGGLGLFLYGMSVMGSSLERFAGGKLEKILETFTSNPIKGVILGAIVTAIIQSSSATTVMTVGFVNSGIMNLTQAIGIIMGSNIGTTVTGWILSLAGIESSNFLVMLFMPKNFCLIFAAIGAGLCVFSKSEKKNNIGYILIGFTILIYGMDFMSTAVSPLRNDPGFQNLLVMFKNPFMGVLIGAVVTAIVQSSSASIGILQAISSTGAITYSSAIPIILGQNIGTCVTAMISSIGAKREARRVAFVHLYFNIIGTLIFLTIVYLIQNLIGFAFWNNAIPDYGIALFHTIFNVFCTLIFLPFTKLLAKLATMTVKDKGEPVEVIPGVSLDTRFLSSPGFALQQCKKTVTTMCGMITDNIMLSAETVKVFTPDKLAGIQNEEQNINRIADRLNAYIVQVTKLPLSTQESRYISKLLHSIRSLERIADSAKRLAETAGNVSANGIMLSDEAEVELEHLLGATCEMLSGALKGCADDDAKVAAEIYPLTEVVHIMCNTFRAAHIERVKHAMCSAEAGIYFDELLVCCEHIADRSAAIIIQVISLKDDNYRSQEYIESIHMESSEEFRENYNAFKDKYLQNAVLPAN